IKRTAQSVSENVVTVARTGQPGEIVEEIIRVQGLVALVLVGAAVKLLCAGLHNDVYGRAGIAAVFSLVVREQDLHFSDRVHAGRVKVAGVVAGIGIGDAVERDVGAVAATALNEDAAVGAKPGRVAILGVDHAGEQPHGP